jgi:hypothetical protein
MFDKFKVRNTLATLFICFLAGCASTQNGFIRQANLLDDLDVCQNYVKDYGKLYDYKSGWFAPADATEEQYLNSLSAEIDSRSLSYSYCETVVAEQKRKITTGVLIGAVAAAAVAAIAASGDGGGGYGRGGYAWDEFNDGYGNLIYRCRDRSNGEFAVDQNCAGMAKNDYTWPGK